MAAGVVIARDNGEGMEGEVFAEAKGRAEKTDDTPKRSLIQGLIQASHAGVRDNH